MVSMCCLVKEADNVGFVSITQPAIANQKSEILQAFPHTKALISFVCRMNRDNIRSPTRSIANVKFHHIGEEINGIAMQIL